jgi:hypothetical protein
MSTAKSTPHVPTKDQTEQRLRNYQQKRTFNFLVPPMRVVVSSRQCGKTRGQK